MNRRTVVTYLVSRPGGGLGFCVGVCNGNGGCQVVTLDDSQLSRTEQRFVEQAASIILKAGGRLVCHT